MHPRASAWLSRLLLDRAEGYRRRVLAAAESKINLACRSREDIESHQTDALVTLLRHAADAVPFYRSRLPGAHDISAVNARECVALLPVVDKAIIKQDPASFQAANMAPTFENATGGSTGTPFTFRIDRLRQIAGEASHIWANGLAGWQIGERVAMLWGSDADVRGETNHWRVRLRNGILNTRWYNAFNMGPERMADFHRDMSRFKPHLIVAYAGSMFHYAGFLQEKGWTPSYPLRGVVTSAEVLSPAMRARIELVFGPRVFDRYGSREFGPLAAEDPAHQGMVVNEGDCLLEIDSPEPERNAGSLLVTYFQNQAQPFIRYRTGDLARWAPEVEGHARRIAEVVGRESDTMRGPDGQLVHGEYFTHIFYDSPGVETFQFVQDRLDHARLLVVADRAKVQSDEPTWRSKMAEVLGDRFLVDIEYVDDIPLLPSGKYKFTISKIEDDTSCG